MWINFLVAALWAYAIVIGLLIWGVAPLLGHWGAQLPEFWPPVSPFPEDWGEVLALTYLAQALMSSLIDERFERGAFRSLFWVIWYPMVFWAAQAATLIVGVPRAIWHLGQMRGRWISPDRGLR